MGDWAKRRRWIASASASALLALSLPAVAQDAASKAAARELSIEAVKQAQAGDCAGAIPKLQRAESLFHAPTILTWLGECQVKVGRLVEGTENLNRVVREQLAPDAPEAFVKAQTRARELLGEALPKIARLKIEVEAPPGTSYVVKVGGKEVPPAMVGLDRPTDPGTHAVTASADGFETAAQTVTLREGGSESITLRLEQDPTAVAAAPPPATPGTAADPPVASPTPSPEPAIDPGPTTGASKTPGYVVLGVGGAALVAGGVTGILALGKKNDLDDGCVDKQCPPPLHGDVDSANTLGLISTIGFAAGAVGIGLGTFLVIRAGKKEKAARRRFVAEPYLGVGSAGVRGSF